MNKDIEALKKEIEMLKLEKERELIYAKTDFEKQKLLMEINELRKAKKQPSRFMKDFKKGLRTSGRGINYLWKGIKNASNNLERRDSDLRQASRPSNSGLSNPARMYLPKQSYYTPKRKKQKKNTSRRKSRNKSMPMPVRQSAPAWSLP